MKKCIRCKKAKGPGHKCSKESLKEERAEKKTNPYMKALANG